MNCITNVVKGCHNHNSYVFVSHILFSLCQKMSPMGHQPSRERERNPRLIVVWMKVQVSKHGQPESNELTYGGLLQKQKNPKWEIDQLSGQAYMYRLWTGVTTVGGVAHLHCHSMKSYWVSASHCAKQRYWYSLDSNRELYEWHKKVSKGSASENERQANVWKWTSHRRRNAQSYWRDVSLLNLSRISLPMKEATESKIVSTQVDVIHMMKRSVEGLYQCRVDELPKTNFSSGEKNA